MDESDSPWGWQARPYLDRDLFEDAEQALERYALWSLSRREEYVGRLMITGAVTEAQGNELLRTYCNGIEDERDV